MHIAVRRVESKVAPIESICEHLTTMHPQGMLLDLHSGTCENHELHTVAANGQNLDSQRGHLTKPEVLDSYDCELANKNACQPNFNADTCKHRLNKSNEHSELTP